MTKTEYEKYRKAKSEARKYKRKYRALISQDLIKRSDAITALGEEPLVWNDDLHELAVHEQWQDYVKAIKKIKGVDENV